MGAARTRRLGVVGLSPTVGRPTIECVRKGGSVTLVGNLKPQVDLPLQAVVTRELTLIGTCASLSRYPACLKLIASGQINVTGLYQRDRAAGRRRAVVRTPLCR